MQPASPSQESSVHASPSSQFRGAPPAQVPPEHVSPTVQASPSSHGSALSVCTQPVAGSQLSSVQTFPSSQSGGAPPTQVPSEHVSPVVQASPSSHGSVVSVCTQSPVAGSQLSSVQSLPSLQSGGAPPTQVPPEHVSPTVQASPSSQGVPSNVQLSAEHPVTTSITTASTIHARRSSFFHPSISSHPASLYRRT
jgi:hypothetical protein